MKILTTDRHIWDFPEATNASVSGNTLHIIRQTQFATETLISFSLQQVICWTKGNHLDQTP